ncbi:MAG: YtxH domain-containing protein [Actinobacteria bacterium]|nr:YtxH domain-containing protein [Actinomycetota bacterium]MBM3713648.1 YtxH domain-containing protein [Actinomycetota bacterium]
MNKKNSKNLSVSIFRDIFIISLLSAFSGFVLGLLFAPQSGRNFRKYLSSRFREVVDRSKFAVIEARIKAEEIIEKSREKVEKAASRFSEDSADTEN